MGLSDIESVTIHPSVLENYGFGTNIDYFQLLFCFSHSLKVGVIDVSNPHRVFLVA